MSRMGMRNGGPGAPAIGAALLLVVASLVGLAITLGSCEPASRDLPPRAAMVPTREDTATGAVEAWLARTSRPAMFVGTVSRRRLLDDLVASGARDSVGRGLRESAAAFASDQAATAVVVATSAGIRVVRDSGSEAVVDAKQLVLRSEPAAAPVVSIASTRVSLVREDRWRISGLDVRARPLGSFSHAEIRRLTTEVNDVP